MVSREYQLLLEESSSLGILFFRIDLRYHKVEWVSPGVKDLLGYDHTILKGWKLERFRSYVHPQDVAVMHNYLGFILRRDKDQFQGIIRIRHSNGNYIQFLGISISEGYCAEKDHEIAAGALICLERFPEGLGLLVSTHESERIEDRKAIIDSLTRRELEVLCFFAKGYSCREVAEKLSISFHTVDTYRKILLRKMKMKNVAELAAFAGACALV